MSASMQEYKSLIQEIYEKKVKGCPNCSGLNPECHCMKKFEHLCAIANAKIPYRFRYAKTEQFTVIPSTVERQTVEKYIKHLGEMKKQGIGFWINGDMKSGKSLLICSVLVAAIKADFSAYYLEMNEFYRLQEIRYSEISERYQKTLKTLHEVDFLAIDSIGVGQQGAKQASKQSLAHLFQQRIDAKKPTIIGSLIKEASGLGLITPEFPSLVLEGCPIEIQLVDSDFVEMQAKERKKLFEDLP